MDHNKIRLARQELFDLVWSMPMGEIAQKFEITDVGHQDL